MMQPSMSECGSAIIVGMSLQGAGLALVRVHH